MLMLVLCAFAATTSFAQDADALYQEGIELHEAGEYQAAIAKYKEALDIYPGHPRITYVMAYAYQAMGNYGMAQTVAEKGLKANKKSTETANLFLILGNSYLFQEQFSDALKTYKKGIKKYPTYYMLHFSSGLTHYYIGDAQDGSAKSSSFQTARGFFEKSIKLEPGHAASHYYLAFMVDHWGMKIPTLMTISRFLALEPEGERAQFLYPFLGPMMMMNPEVDDNNAFNLVLNGDDDKEDNFMIIDMSLQVISLAGLESDEDDDGDDDGDDDATEEDPLPDFSEMTYIEQFVFKYDFMCSQIKSSAEEGNKKGYFWEEYAPYFIALYDAGHVETFCHIINVNHEDDGEDILEWIEDNGGNVEAFFAWQQKYMEDSAKAE